MAAVRRALHRLQRNRLLCAGLAALIALFALAWIVPAFRPDPNLADIDHGLTELGAPLPPSLDAPLGTDDLGRDQLARVAHAARASLVTIIAASAIALALGLLVGLTAGLSGGWVDSALLRLIELAVAFPVLLLAILAAAVLRAAELDEARSSLAVVLGLVGWPVAAQVIRARAMTLTHAGHIVAARALGAGRWRVIVHHVLPDIAGVLAVLLTSTVAQLLLTEATLSFVGLGAPPPEPSWGRMVYEGRVYYRSAPWLMLAPGLALLVAVTAFHLLGAGVRREIQRDAS